MYIAAKDTFREEARPNFELLGIGQDAAATAVKTKMLTLTHIAETKRKLSIAINCIQR